MASGLFRRIPISVFKGYVGFYLKLLPSLNDKKSLRLWPVYLGMTESDARLVATILWLPVFFVEYLSPFSKAMSAFI